MKYFFNHKIICVFVFIYVFFFKFQNKYQFLNAISNFKHTCFMEDLIELEPFESPRPPISVAPTWIQSAKDYIGSLLLHQPSIIIHRSKLFSLFDSFRSLQKDFYPRTDLSNEILKQACSDLIECVNKTRQVVYSCSTAHWSQCAISWPSGTVKESVRRLRDDMQQCIQLFQCSNPPNFLITSEELDAQNQVDLLQLKGSLLEYMAHVNELPQTPQLNRAIALINKRIASIGPIPGLNDGPALVNIPPFLPSELNLVLHHSDFTIGETIGSGTFGTVHTGTLHGLHKKVAVKVLSGNVLSGRQLETFKREVWTLANISHPAILRLLGVTLTPPYCIITELLRSSLFDRLKYLNPTQRSIIASRVASGMVQIHSARIIHRDLKSANILLDEDDLPRICDFGLVGFKRSGTRTGFVGTAQWMAPEVLRSHPFYDEKVDVYSFAVVLWELLMQEVPFAGLSQDQLVLGVLDNDLRPEIPIRMGPPALISLIKRCWDNDPGKRPSFFEIEELLARREFHFLGTNEELFQKYALKEDIAQEIIEAFDRSDFTRIDTLLEQVDAKAIKNNPELINAIVSLFNGLDSQRCSRILRKMPKWIDMEHFIRMRGYMFIVGLLSQQMNSKIIDAAVFSLRTIPLDKPGFRQNQLIASLAKCMRPSAVLLLADLCIYEDVARNVTSQNLIPFDDAFENDQKQINLLSDELLQARLDVYGNLLQHSNLRKAVCKNGQILGLAAREVALVPDKVCRVVKNFIFTPEQAQAIFLLGLIEKFALSAIEQSNGLETIEKMIEISSIEQLEPYKNTLDKLLNEHYDFFSNSNVFYKIQSIINPSFPKPPLLDL